tara:strand:+ start:1111 stop:2037 length:927 start_codon:yes stop_codon:yes gene_type:complete
MVRFRFFDSAKPNPDEPTATIVLPSPLQLSNNYNVSFDDLEAGLFEVALDTFIDKTSDFVGVVQGGGDALEVGASLFGGLVDGVAKVATSVVAGTDVARRLVGAGKNKRNEMVVNKPQNRTFNLRFQLVPSNKEEADSIQNIVNTFKIAMHPPTNQEVSQVSGFEGKVNKSIFFMNPARVKVDFLFRDGVMKDDGTFDFSTDNINRRLFSTSFCFIRNLGVNYHNAGAPSYFKDGQPGNMSFDIEIAEVHPNSRDMIKKIDLGPGNKFSDFTDTVNPIDSVADRSPEPIQGAISGIAGFLGLSSREES